MFNNRQMYANKLIQTREILNDSMTIGSILNLIVDIDIDSKTKPQSEPYYYIGSTNNVGYFIRADIVNEKNLLTFKKSIAK